MEDKMKKIFRSCAPTIHKSNVAWGIYTEAKDKADKYHSDAALLLKKVYHTFYDLVEKRYNVQPHVRMLVDNTTGKQISGVRVSWVCPQGNFDYSFLLSDIEGETNEDTKKTYEEKVESKISADHVTNKTTQTN